MSETISPVIRLLDIPGSDRIAWKGPVPARGDRSHPWNTSVRIQQTLNQPYDPYLIVLRGGIEIRVTHNMEAN